ncbi:unnamed protein product, partial [Staurois parvus]
SVLHQCHISVPTSAHQCHISCPSELPFSANYQCHASQCRQSVPPINAIHECCLSVPISDACQCPSVPPTSASSSVPPISAHQCSLSVPITAASLAHISEGETF